MFHLQNFIVAEHFKRRFLSRDFPSFRTIFFRYVSTHNFKVSEADKIAIRPTYEKYRYETRGEDDVYDDEYDDGYEQKEFTVEPLK